VLKHRRATVLAHLVVLMVCAQVAAAQDSSSRFGHRAYAEASHSLVRSVGVYRASGRVVQLLPVAAAAFDSLRAAARADSVRLVPISGFRPVAYERDLFARAIRRHGSDSAAARWVAPAGFSEHHTGLAIDIGDHGSPRCDTEACFASTRGSRWLLANAGRFGFELSFPEGNGAVSHEPWHWRFIGDSASRAVFNKARVRADSAAVLRAFAAHYRCARP